MKLLLTALLIYLELFSTSAFAINSKPTKNNESKNMIFITQLYKEIYEKKAFDQMDKYISGDVAFYKNFSRPLSYDAFKKHLVDQGEECIKINMLPFDTILASGNKIVTLYTRNCTDKFNKKHKRRVMAITEINSRRMISKIWVVSNEES